MTADSVPAPIAICDLTKNCADGNANRWYCLRGHALPEESKPAVKGVCPLTRCDRKGANRG